MFASDEAVRQTPWRIAVAEDDPFVREDLVQLISADKGLDMAGIAGTVRAARSLIEKKPDLFLLDIGLPDGSGLDFIPEIKRGCGARILILSSFGDRETVVCALEAGADGYLLKDSPASFITEGIHVTLAGGAPISAAAAVYLLERLRFESSPSSPTVSEGSDLSPREADLLRLFARGLSYKEAAREMGIAPATITSYVNSVYRKLAVHSRGEAVFEATRTGKLRMD